MLNIGSDTKKQALGFSVITGIGTGIDFLFLWILTEKVWLSVMIAATISFLISVLWNYSVLRWTTFPNSTASHTRGLLRYCTVAIGSLGVHTAGIFLWFDFFHFGPFSSKALTMAMVFCWSFPMNKIWTFQ